jgi:hypothetical protein
MKRISIIVLAVMLVGVLGSFASDSGITGREVVAMGILQTMEGTLVEEDDEWYLQTGEILYAVHLGNYDFLDTLEMDLNEGDRVTLKGFVHGEDIAAVNIITGDNSYSFRREDGKPLWASSVLAGVNGSGEYGQGDSESSDDECSEETPGKNRSDED